MSTLTDAKDAYRKAKEKSDLVKEETGEFSSWHSVVRDDEAHAARAYVAALETALAAEQSRNRRSSERRGYPW